MDAVGSRRAAIMGFSEGGPMSMLFAATYPERTAALVLYSTPVSWSRTDQYPWGPTREEVREIIRARDAAGDRGSDRFCQEFLEGLAPTTADDPETQN
jgi:pimeloyl-ACP methyl ester carboxylesterase